MSGKALELKRQQYYTSTSLGGKREEGNSQWATTYMQARIGMGPHEGQGVRGQGEGKGAVRGEAGGREGRG